MSNVNAIPNGMHTVTPHLVCAGAAEAIEFYKKAFNATEAMRVHGGYGYSTEFPVERLYRDAPLLVIGEGTNELQRIIIARQLVARNPV